MFRHELLREAVLELLPATRQIPLHRLVLDALRRAAPRDELLARLAHHAEWAGDRQAVLEFAPAAARRAAQLGAHHEAAAQYARALRWADGLAPRGRALLLEGRGLECYLVDQASEAIDARRAAVQIWHELGDREREGDNLRWLSRTYWLGARNVEAQQASQQALDVLERLSPGESLAYALSNHAQLHRLAGDTLTALAASERAISIARSLGAADALAHAGLSHGAALWSTGDERGRAEIEVILRSSLTTGMHDHAARAYATLVGVHGGNYELDQAERYLARGLEYVVEHDLRVYRHYLQGWQVVLHLRRGRWNEAIESAQRIVTSGEPSIVLHVNALAAIGLVHARRGDPGAWATLDEALELAERIGEPQRLVPVRTARAEAAWLAGDFNRVASEAASLYATAMNRWHGRDADEAMFWRWRRYPRADLPRARGALRTSDRG